MVGRHIAAHAALLFCAGCYLSHPISRETTTTRDAGTDAATIVSCELLRPVEARQLTVAPDDKEVLDVAVLGDGEYLVGWGSPDSDPPHDRHRRVQRASLHGASGEPAYAFDPPTGSYGGMGLATRSGGLVASTWDELGCWLRLVDATGTPTGSALRAPLATCAGIHQTVDGFALFDRPGLGAPTALHRFDAAGTLIGSGPELDVLGRDVFWWSRAVLAADEELVVAMPGGVSASAIVAQRIDAAGAPTGGTVSLPASAPATRVRAAALAEGAVVGWMESRAGDPASQETGIRLVLTDRDGVPTRELGVLPDVLAYRDAGWSILRFGRDLLVAYVEPAAGDPYGDRTRVKSVLVATDGTVRQRVTLAAARFARGIVARTNGSDVLVAFHADAVGLDPITETEIFYAGVECASSP